MVEENYLCDECGPKSVRINESTIKKNTFKEYFIEETVVVIATVF